MRKKQLNGENLGGHEVENKYGNENCNSIYFKQNTMLRTKFSSKY